MRKEDYNKPTYKCGICDSAYESIQQRMNCEMSCLKKQKEKEKAAAAAKLKAEKNTRFSEASAAIDNALALVNKCVEDYGEFSYNGKLEGSIEPIRNYFPSRLWHRFLF